MFRIAKETKLKIKVNLIVSIKVKVTREIKIKIKIEVKIEIETIKINEEISRIRAIAHSAGRGPNLNKQNTVAPQTARKITKTSIKKITVIAIADH